MNVVPFPGLSVVPHTEGPVLCVECKHEWVGVAPCGTVGLECPNCGLAKGVRKSFIEASEGDIVFICGYCEGTLFTLYKDQVLCAGCGFSNSWHDLVGD